jgi:hypothetical protein
MGGSMNAFDQFGLGFLTIVLFVFGLWVAWGTYVLVKPLINGDWEWAREHEGSSVVAFVFWIVVIGAAVSYGLGHVLYRVLVAIDIVHVPQ